MPVYCLFCRTRMTGEIAARMERMDGVRAIEPRILQRKWVMGRPTEEEHPYLPGYVFVYSRDEIADRLHAEGVLRVLGDGPLSGSDLEFADMIRERNGIISNVKVCRVGDRLEILRGPMDGYTGEILRVDRSRARLQMQFEFDGIVWKTWVGFDVVE